jgi:hypothetical protein
MKLSSIKYYLRHYGKIRSLRGSVIQSTFKRTTAAFDDFNGALVEAAMKTLDQSPDRLTCVYCGKEATCWDHLLPAAKGGTHQLRNLAPACADCNKKKGGKTWQTFFDDLGSPDDNAERRKTLALYTKDFQAGESLVDKEDQEKLNELLNIIHQAMSDADKVIAAAIAKRKAGQK